METRTKAKEKVFVLDGKSKNKDSVKRKMKLLRVASKTRNLAKPEIR